MVDVAHSKLDGVSSGTGSPGTGLGALQRMGSDFEIHSQPSGTIQLARVRPTGVGRSHLARRIGAICLPVPGEFVCGDGWGASEESRNVAVVVVDGLGHGPQAAAASQAALDVFETQPWENLPRLVEECHRALQTTRGAALLALQARAEHPLQYAGAGNVAGRVVSGVLDRSFVTQHGTLGVQFRRAEVAQTDWPEHAVVVLHSDGVATRWQTGSFASLLSRDPTLMAAAIAWEHSRGRDDLTVVVLKEGEHQ